MRVLRAAIVLFILLTMITGVIYPLLVTGIARVAFGHQADGSIIERNGKAIGSELIAQNFTDAKYFWPRPSAANYDGANGTGSNLGPTNPALHDAIRDRIAALRAADPGNEAPVPADLVTASGSGLDPHISLEGATYQLARVARSRHMSEEDVRKLLERYAEDRTFGVLGEPRVNVLTVNLALDEVPSR